MSLLHAYIQEIETLISRLKETTTSEIRFNELCELRELIDSFEASLGVNKDEYVTRIHEYKSEYQRLKNAGNSSESSGSIRPNSSIPSSSSSILKQSLDQLLETEKVGQSTLDELSMQEDTIKKCTMSIKETKSGLDVGNNLLNKMRSWWR